MAARKDYLDWEGYFMSIALLAAKRSKDPDCQVGACVVAEDKSIVGVGWNGMPKGNDDLFPWNKTESKWHTKFPYVCHAELNAIVYRNSVGVKDCTIYVTRFPCNECAKLIIQSGIKKVVYLSSKKFEKMPYVTSQKMLEGTDVILEQYKPRTQTIEINFQVDATLVMEVQ